MQNRGKDLSWRNDQTIFKETQKLFKWWHKSALVADKLSKET